LKKKCCNKVFILTNSLKSGGAEKQSILLAKALQEYYDTTLIVYYGLEYDDKLKDLAADSKIKIIWMKGSHPAKVLSIFRLLKGDKNSVVFSFLLTSNLLNAIVGGLAGTRIRIGGIRNERLSPWKLIIQKILHNYLLTVSVFNNFKGMELLCAKGFRRSKAQVVHNCILIQQPQGNSIHDDNTVVIASLGRFVEQKDYFTALDAINKLNQKLSRSGKESTIRYKIGGYGPLEKKIREYTHSINLDYLTDIEINPSNISSFLSSADIFLSTSLFEGLSNSIMEAMENSLPVVATRVGDNEYLIKDGKTGFLSQIKDSDEIADNLFALVTNKELRRNLGASGYKHLLEYFSFEAFREKYLNLIDHLSIE
jgi:glycosyltransferase involved in cell wall biosynthesis